MTKKDSPLIVEQGKLRVVRQELLKALGWPI
jgi:hypothetical protein